MKTRNNKLLVIVFTIFIFTANTFAQQIQVSGIVTDAQTHELIVGATVTEKGSKKGTVTDTKRTLQHHHPTWKKIGYLIHWL